jgi:hypothetical protein
VGGHLRLRAVGRWQTLELCHRDGACLDEYAMIQAFLTNF